MKLSSLFKPFFVLSLLVIFIGAFFKIMHLTGGQIFIVASVILSIIWIVIGLYEIHGSKQISRREKIMWTVGFILFGAFTGLVYLFIGRQRVLSNYKYGIR